MDNQTCLYLNWANSLPQYKCMEELGESLILTMELEDTKLQAREKLKARDEQIAQLNGLLSRALKERDRAQEKCQQAILETLILQHQIQQSGPFSGVSSIEDGPRPGLDGISVSDCEDSIVSSPRNLTTPAAELPAAPASSLPEKGKLLRAVMKAGPLLQTLLLTGPLPRWRHPPPPLETYEIPPAAAAAGDQDPVQSMLGLNKCGRTVGSFDNRKRGFCEGSESSSMGFKYQRVVLH